MTPPRLLLYDYPTSICSQMARLALVEKGLPFGRRTVDIMVKAEQFEPWYTALNPRAVVPTLAIGEEIVTDTIRIVYRVERDFEGPPLAPAEPAAAEAMDKMMRNIMGLHYGVLMYSRRLDANGKSPTVIARGEHLRHQLAAFPDRAKVLERRIEGNARLQKLLADPNEIERHIGEARDLVNRLEAVLASHPFVAGDAYTLADTFAAPALARFRIHGFEHWWSGGARPGVEDYYRRMQARPSWAAAEVVDTGTERDL